MRENVNFSDSTYYTVAWGAAMFCASILKPKKLFDVCYQRETAYDSLRLILKRVNYIPNVIKVH